MTTLADPSLAGRRRAALDAFEGSPLPPRAEHLWRYTDPARLLPGDLPVSATGFHDTIPIQPGVRVASLEAALGEEEVRARFATLSNEGTGKFEALNLARRGAGVLVAIEAGARADRPIEIVHGQGAGADLDAGTLACPRALVLVGEGAEASVVEAYGPEWSPSLVHGVTEIFLAPGARLVHAVVNEFGGKVRANLVQKARLESGASLTSVAVGLGGELVKVDGSAVLAGENARSEVVGFNFGAGRQHLDLHFFQDHAAPRTRSDLLVRAALRDRARSSYTGQLRIAVDAPGSEAHQENRNLLLSDAARADSIPELEILTHEVQCSHAAATGPVDRSQLFYLQGRGVSAAEAERLVVMGFLEPVFARIPGEAFADSVRAIAARRLGGE